MVFLLVLAPIDDGQAVLVLLAVVASVAGDMLLLGKRKALFLGGLGAFLVAHLMWAASFWQLPISEPRVALVFVAMAAPSAAVLYWLWPHLKGPMRPAVIAYVIAISWMVACAWSLEEKRIYTLAAIGALMFAASDLAVARQRFVVAAGSNRMWGLPLYYAAQFVLIVTVLG